MALKALADRIAREARSFESVEQGRLLGRRAYKVSDQVFVHIDVLKDHVQLDVALPPTDYVDVLSLPFAIPHKFAGPPWVTLRLRGTEPFNLVRSWIRKSYELRAKPGGRRRHADRTAARSARARTPVRHRRRVR